MEPSLSTVMSMPVWLTKYDPMRSNDHHCIANLAKNPPSVVSQRSLQRVL